MNIGKGSSEPLMKKIKIIEKIFLGKKFKKKILKKTRG